MGKQEGFQVVGADLFLALHQDRHVHGNPPLGLVPGGKRRRVERDAGLVVGLIPARRAVPHGWWAKTPATPTRPPSSAAARRGGRTAKAWAGQVLPCGREPPRRGPLREGGGSPPGAFPPPKARRPLPRRNGPAPWGQNRKTSTKEWPPGPTSGGWFRGIQPGSTRAELLGPFPPR